MTEPTDDEIMELAKLFITRVGSHWESDDAIPDNGRIEDFARAVLAKWGTPAPVGVALSDDLRDRLVAISEAIADQDDRAAQAMLREILKTPQPSPAAQGDASDPLQGAANWLVSAHTDLAVSTLAGKLSIGYNRAKRLIDAARAAYEER